MKIIADTNLLVRAIAEDDIEQARVAQRLLSQASVVAIPIVAFAEFCWVIATIYKFDRNTIATVIRSLVAAHNVVTDMPAVELGLAILSAGGDFADGVIAQNGKWLGGERFVSFDRKAVKLLEALGEDALLAG